MINQIEHRPKKPTFEQKVKKVMREETWKEFLERKAERKERWESISIATLFSSLWILPFVTWAFHGNASWLLGITEGILIFVMISMWKADENT